MGGREARPIQRTHHDSLPSRGTPLSKQTQPAPTTTIPNQQNSSNHSRKFKLKRATKLHIPRRVRHQRKLRDDKVIGDTNHSLFYGDDIADIRSGTLRIFFQNVRGITSTNDDEDTAHIMSIMHDLHVDVMGLAETQTPWKQQELRNKFHQRGRRQFGMIKTAFGSPSHIVDPPVMRKPSKPEARSLQHSENGRRRFLVNLFRTQQAWVVLAA